MSMPNERLLRALVEQLKLPLLQIARHAELALASSTNQQAQINDIAVMALQLLDGYLLSADLHTQTTLQLEPVSVSSVLYDAAHELSGMAKHYNHPIQIKIAGKYGPVMAHQPSLRAALTVLGYSFMESMSGSSKQPLVLSAYKSKDGLVTGLFSDQAGLSADMFRRGQALFGISRQPLPSLTASAGAGVFVADSLFSAMATNLRIARHDKLTGLAATLLRSPQLQLIYP